MQIIVPTILEYVNNFHISSSCEVNKPYTKKTFSLKQIKFSGTIQSQDFIKSTHYTPISSNINQNYFPRIFKLGHIFLFNFSIYYLNKQHV